MRKFDDVKYPNHYNWISGFPCEKIAGRFDFFRGNVFKYIYRSGHKKVEGLTMEQSRIKDLRKAIEYLKKSWESHSVFEYGYLISLDDVNTLEFELKPRLFEVFRCISKPLLTERLYRKALGILYAEIRYGKLKE